MNQLDPEKRAILAGEYVLGTLPAAARARFAHRMQYDPVLARLADQWARRFSVIDERTLSVTPPARVWRAIEARTAPRTSARTTPLSGSWRQSLAFWRTLALGAVAVAAALVVIIATGVMTPRPTLVAVLSDKEGHPAWVVSEDRGGKTLAVEAVRTQEIDRDHDFELWCIAAGKPWALGVISSKRDHRVTIPSWEMPGNGVALAVSVEPFGGSRTGQPTGPVLYQGKVLTD